MRRFDPGLLVYALFGLLALVVWPARLGGSTSFVFVSGESMEPRLHSGDLTVVRSADDYQVGDIVAYRVPDGGPVAGDLIIHRIVGQTQTETQTRFIVSGDNTSGDDQWKPTRDDVVGRVVFDLPITNGPAWAMLPWLFGGLIGVGVVMLLWPRTVDVRTSLPEGVALGPIPWPPPDPDTLVAVIDRPDLLSAGSVGASVQN